MAVVKFLGTLRLDTGIGKIEVDEKFMEDILRSIHKQYDNIQYNELKRAIIYINDKKYIKPLFRRVAINQDDVISILYPVAGG